MVRKLSSKRKSIQTSVAETLSSGTPLIVEPAVESPNSSSEGAFDNPQETALALELLCLEDVTSWLNVYSSIMQHPKPILQCSFSYDLAYSVLYHESVLGDKVPRQNIKRMPQGNGGGVFFYSKKLKNCTAVGTGKAISFSGNKVKRFSATFGLCEQHNDMKAKSGLIGRQYQLLDKNGVPFGPLLIIAYPTSNAKWIKSKQPVNSSKRAAKRARAGNRPDGSSSSSTISDIYPLTTASGSATEALAHLSTIPAANLGKTNWLAHANSTADSAVLQLPPTIPSTAEPADFRDTLNAEWDLLYDLHLDDDFGTLPPTTDYPPDWSSC